MSSNRPGLLARTLRALSDSEISERPPGAFGRDVSIAVAAVLPASSRRRTRRNLQAVAGMGGETMAVSPWRKRSKSAGDQSHQTG